MLAREIYLRHEVWALPWLAGKLVVLTVKLECRTSRDRSKNRFPISNLSPCPDLDSLGDDYLA